MSDASKRKENTSEEEASDWEKNVKKEEGISGIGK